MANPATPRKPRLTYKRWLAALAADHPRYLRRFLQDWQEAFMEGFIGRKRNDQAYIEEFLASLSSEKGD